MIQQLKKLLDFFKKYENLCKESGFGISACGCCNSPFLNYGENRKVDAEAIIYKKEKLTFDLLIMQEDTSWKRYLGYDIEKTEKLIKEIENEKIN